jgi:hypothetical protein
MRSISESVDIAASRHQVWKVLTDLSAYKDWNPFIQSASGQLTVGSTLTLRLVPAHGRPITFRPKVLDAEPHVLLRWIGHLIVPGIFDGTHQFELEDLDGFTRVTQSETFRGLLIPFTGRSITATKADFRALNQALKTRVERTVAESADSSHS